MLSPTSCAGCAGPPAPRTEWPRCHRRGRTMLRLLLLASLLINWHAVSTLQLPRANHRRQEHKYLLSHAAARSREPAFMVAAVTSPASSHDRRSWIRQQWARNIALLHSDNATSTPPRIVMKFAVGVNDSSREALAALHKEEEEWGDILLLQGVKDLDPADIGWPWQV